MLLFTFSAVCLPIVSEAVNTGGFKSSALILITKLVSANFPTFGISVARTIILYSLADVLDTGAIWVTTPFWKFIWKKLAKSGGLPLINSYFMVDLNVSWSSAWIFSGETSSAPELIPETIWNSEKMGK